jgi:hypothetical protein
LNGSFRRNSTVQSSSLYTGLVLGDIHVPDVDQRAKAQAPTHGQRPICQSWVRERPYSAIALQEEGGEAGHHFPDTRPHQFY